MNQISTEFLEQNNNNVIAKNILIRNENNETKINLIKSVISEEIPLNFKPMAYSSTDKIFYKTIDGKLHRREWLLFQNNRFYCVYCICFSALSENRFIQGVEYIKSCRITEKLTSHDKESHHKLARSTYLNLVSDSNSEKNIYHAEKRNAIKIIVKIIIYIATHGK